MAAARGLEREPFISLRCGRLPRNPRGVAGELLEHVADIANIKPTH